MSFQLSKWPGKLVLRTVLEGEQEGEGELWAPGGLQPVPEQVRKLRCLEDRKSCSLMNKPPLTGGTCEHLGERGWSPGRGGTQAEAGSPGTGGLAFSPAAGTWRFSGGLVRALGAGWWVGGGHRATDEGPESQKHLPAPGRSWKSPA